MREIRFRAWDKIDKKMHKVSMLNPTSEYGEKYSTVYFEEKTNSNDGHRNYAEIELMQYAGLKDKNGKEIYEGDIVKGTKGQKGKSEVSYKNCIWQPFGYLEIYDGKEFEIIGNIYENPELLEDK